MSGFRTWLTADIHINHERIREYCPIRVFKSTEHMNEGLVANINSVVGPKDRVIVLGDCLMGRIEDGYKYLSRINGLEGLIEGNHDQKALRRPEFRAFFKWILQRSEMPVKVNGRDVTLILSHYPAKIEDLIKDGTQFRLHGHSHGSIPYDVSVPQMDVGLDAQNLFPISLDAVLERVAAYHAFLKLDPLQEAKNLEDQPQSTLTSQ